MASYKQVLILFVLFQTSLGGQWNTELRFNPLPGITLSGPCQWEINVTRREDRIPQVISEVLCRGSHHATCDSNPLFKVHFEIQMCYFYTLIFLKKRVFSIFSVSKWLHTWMWLTSQIQAVAQPVTLSAIGETLKSGSGAPASKNTPTWSNSSSKWWWRNAVEPDKCWSRVIVHVTYVLRNKTCMTRLDVYQNRISLVKFVSRRLSVFCQIRYFLVPQLSASRSRHFAFYT